MESIYSYWGIWLLLLPVAKDRRIELEGRVERLQGEARDRYNELRGPSEPEFLELLEIKAGMLRGSMERSEGRISDLVFRLEDFYDGISEEGSAHCLKMYSWSTGTASRIRPEELDRGRFYHNTKYFCGEQISYMGYAGLLHDDGKALMPRVMKEKMKRGIYFDQEEFELMQLHVIMGYDVLRKAANGDECLRNVAPIILCHHERRDGMGYLLGLTMDETPPASRIISAVDACLAMVMKRSYDTETPPLWAIEEIKRCAGLPFNENDLIEYNREKLAGLKVTEGQNYEGRLRMMFQRNTRFGEMLPPGYDRGWYDEVVNRASLSHLEDAYLIVRLSSEKQFDPVVALGLEKYALGHPEVVNWYENN